MGITGLLPFLKPSTRPASVREFAGGAVGIDAYSWLHKGAFACADRLARGEHTDVHVAYCMRYVNMLLAHGVRPILVFDGRHLPSKAGTEAKRRDGRRRYRALAADHLRAGRDREARECFQRCVDVTPAMARQLIQACRARGVDCLVAPYEADAQLAYLARRGIVDLVITEDSDLVLFGCPRVLFKMDAGGAGQLIAADALPASLGCSADKFSLERLRLVCILSGCDYVASLPGVGLGKASKLLVRAAGAADSAAVLERLASHLNMRRLAVSDEYKAAVLRAENTFLYQLVFDPLARRLVPLTPYPAGRGAADFPYAGAWMDDAAGLQLALGNVDVATGATVGSFDPDRSAGAPAPHALHRSIWSCDYVLTRRAWPAASCAPVSRATAGKTARISVLEGLKKAAAAAAAAVAGEDDAERRRQAEADMAALYAPRPSPDGSVVPPAGTGSTPDSGIGDDSIADARAARLPVPDTPGASCGVGGADQPAADADADADDQSPTIGGGEARSRNPFRVRGRLRDRLSGAVRSRLGDDSGDALTRIVASKYFATPTPAPAEEPAAPRADPLHAPVQTMEEFLKRRRDSSASLGDASPKRSRRRSRSPPAEAVPSLPHLAEPPAARHSWYKMSSVFDPKHAMTVWDSEVHGLRSPPSPPPPPLPSRSPGKENSSPVRRPPAAGPAVCASKRFLGRSPPAAALFKVRSGPSAGAAGKSGVVDARHKGGGCRAVGLKKPAVARQLNLKQMFAFRRSDAPKLKM